MMQLRRPLGFTLIELMITVAIIAVIAAVAYPSYQDSITKGRRAEGRTALLQVLQQQERFITQRNAYYCFATDPGTGATSVVTPAANGICPSPTSGTIGTVPFKSFSAESFARSAYVLSAENCQRADGTQIAIQDCVRLVAKPRGSHTRDVQGAGDLRITSTGAKDCTGPKASTPGVCWP